VKTPGERVTEALGRERARPLLGAGLLAQPLAVLDLTAANQVLHDVDLADPIAFQAYVDGVLRHAGAAVAVGRYDEDRIVYRHSALFGGGAEARSVHLGLDLFVASSTPLMAPLDGVVHSLGDNASRGDYGPTIVLEHVVGGVCFHSLYGHLDRDSLRRWVDGDVVKAGEPFARIGTNEQNGGWPPHVHVQLIAALGRSRGDFPGVAARSERVRMLGICPDPNVMLRLPELPLPSR
jgi:peptidoglycan LD-endopeptidase LytH